MFLSHDRRVFLYAVLAGLPAVVAVAVLLWMVPLGGLVRGTVLGAVLLLWIGWARASQIRVVRPLQVIANILAGLREGHFTIRAREEEGADVLGAVRRELNALSETLKEQRLGALESDALLKRLMEEIDVAVFAFDPAGVLRVANKAGEQLLAQPIERVLGRTASYLGLGVALEGETPRIIDLTLPGTGSGRWEVRRRRFRQGGVPFDLVVLADISRVLRSEERQVWQRLVRVLSHEINNSLAPIKSVADTLASLLDRTPRAPDLEDDLRKGLGVIAGRADSLNRFMASYARLAKLPPPTPGPVDVDTWISRVVALEDRLPVEIHRGPPLTIEADGDQLDQVLINLLKNAVEASLETRGRVEVGWTERDQWVEVVVRDEGPGLASTTNLFVPFYTTKPSGSGIGLVFSRQVTEAHGGHVALVNRTDRRGTEARLTLPRAFRRQ
jgi:two-component system, NtrC family, nitrogen regulation sensor histidine kinase NtrY